MNLTLKKLYIKDFCSIEEAEIIFPEKILYLTGENGSGKSSIFDAISLLFTENKRGDKFSDYIRSGCPTQKALLKFEGLLNNEEIQIDVVVSETGVARTVVFQEKTFNNSECIELFTKLGVIYFSNLIFFMQKEKLVTDMTPGELADSLQRLLEFDLDKYTSKIKEKIDLIEKDVADKEADLRALQSRSFVPSPLMEFPFEEKELARIKNEIVSLEKEREEETQNLISFNKVGQKRLELEKKITDINSVLTNSESFIGLHNKELELINENKNSLTSTFKKLKEEYTQSVATFDRELKKLDVDLTDQQEKKKGLEEELSLQESQYKSNEDLIVLNEEAHLYFERDESSVEKIKEKEVLVEELNQVSLQKEAVANTIANLKEGLRLKDLQKNKKCPTCGQSTLDVHKLNSEFQDVSGILDMPNNEIISLIDSKTALLKQHIDEATKKTNQIFSKNYELEGLKELMTKKPDATILDRNQAQFNINDLKLKNDKIDEIIQEKKGLIKFSELFIQKSTTIKEEKIRQLNLLKPPSEDELKSKEKEYAAKQEDLINSIQKLTDTMRISKGELEDIQSQLNSLPQLKEVDQNNLNKIIQLINSYRESIEQYNKVLIANDQICIQNEKLEVEKLQVEKDISLIKDTLKTLGDDFIANKEAKSILEKELPNYLIVKTCFKLEKLINDFIHTIFPNMQVELKQKQRGVNFVYTPADTGNVEDKKRKKIPCRMASGMESSILSLAWRYALSQAYGLNIGLYDESDAAADDTNSLRIFTELFQDPQFDQIIVITHKSEVRKNLARSFNVSTYKAIKGKFKVIDNFED